MLALMRERGGGAIAVATEDALAAIDKLAREEGIFACPESATTLVGRRKTIARGWVAPYERVVLVVTGSGLKSIPTLGVPSPPIVTTGEEILTPCSAQLQGLQQAALQIVACRAYQTG